MGELEYFADLKFSAIIGIIHDNSPYNSHHSSEGEQ